MNTYKNYRIVAIIVACVAVATPLASPLSASADTVPAVNINQGQTSPSNPYGGFQLSQCDGPALPNNADTTAYLAQFKLQTGGRDYRACDFNGLMIEAQFLINVMLVVGVLAALCGFAYAGFLMMSGAQDKIKKARSIFPKVIVGFVIMLVAWFAVYQILVWLTGTGTYLQGS